MTSEGNLLSSPSPQAIRDESAEIQREFMAGGDAAGAHAIDEKLQPLHRDLFVEANPIPVKWAVERMGLMDAGIRLPLTWLSADRQPLVREAMRHAGIACRA